MPFIRLLQILHVPYRSVGSLCVRKMEIILYRGIHLLPLRRSQSGGVRGFIRSRIQNLQLWDLRSQNVRFHQNLRTRFGWDRRCCPATTNNRKIYVRIIKLYLYVWYELFIFLGVRIGVLTVLLRRRYHKRNKEYGRANITIMIFIFVY